MLNVLLILKPPHITNYLNFFFGNTISPRNPHGILLTGFKEPKNLTQVYFETPGTLLGEWRELTLFCNQNRRSLM